MNFFRKGPKIATAVTKTLSIGLRLPDAAGPRSPENHQTVPIVGRFEGRTKRAEKLPRRRSRGSRTLADGRGFGARAPLPVTRKSFPCDELVVAAAEALRVQGRREFAVRSAAHGVDRRNFSAGRDNRESTSA